MSTPNNTPLSFMSGAHNFKIPNLTVNGGNDNRKDYRTTNNAEFMIHNNNQYMGGAKHYNPITVGGNSKRTTPNFHADAFVQ
ncbi:hypothetical protein H1R20_g7498, partial [Candolleomyces eurysporus]